MSAGCMAVSPGMDGLLHPRIPLSLVAPPAPSSGLVPLVRETRQEFVFVEPGIDHREFGIGNARHPPCHDCDDSSADLRHDCHHGDITHDEPVRSHYGAIVNFSVQLSGGGTKQRMMPLLGVQQAMAWPVGLSVRFRMTSSGMVGQTPSISA